MAINNERGLTKHALTSPETSHMHWHRAHASLLACVLASSAFAAGPTYTDPEKTDADFPYQGEYVGKVKTSDGDVTVGLQVIALGKGKFHAVGYHGGLPGDGWNKETKREADGELTDGAAVFTGDDAFAKVKDGVATITSKDGVEVGRLDKIQRSSSTLGAKPPEGAVVLFNGKSADAFEGGKTTEDGLLMQGCTSKQKFGSCKVHIEFRTPYQPEDRGQGRGNSGIYVGARYECQMLDSFGLKGENNECGGLYSVRAPDVNMCLPPLAWQTFDIDYTAAKYDGDKLVKNPRVTISHNGVVIHNDVELPGERSTTAAPNKPGPEPGPIYLQDHGNPLRYRNIWVVEKK
jgi:3-keto-disaccharide hydrolase